MGKGFHLIILFVSVSLVQASAPVVKLDNLHIHGVQVADSAGTLCNAYLGIPFAQPPIGDLRWADPKPLAPFKKLHVLHAQITQKQCAQILPEQPEFLAVYEYLYMAGTEYSNNVSFAARSDARSEDCLYLDVFTPNNNGTNRPVMVWIHGGAFSGGSGAGYDARVLAASQDVVVVVIQYRVGIFGFLSTGDRAASGNWGLKDQTLALRWVQQNIVGFGGDPSRVTIFGESAGGASCGMHTVSPYSEGLFHNAILQSGSEYLQNLYSYDSLKSAQYLAKAASCGTKLDSSSLLNCLRSKSTDEIFAALQGVVADATEEVKKGTLSPEQVYTLTTFNPTVGDEFFPEHPLTSTRTNKVNLIIGYTSTETGYLVSFALGFNQPLSAEGFAAKLEFVAQYVALGNSEYIPKIVDLLKAVYAVSEDPHTNMVTAQQIVADSWFVAGAFLKANKHIAQGHKVYLFELLHGPTVFQDRSLLNASLVNGPGLMTKPSHIGADHGDDVPFVFGYPFNPNFEAKGYGSTDGDRLLSGAILKFWGEFARTGSVYGWPAYSSTRRVVMQFDRAEPYTHITDNYRPEVYQLWTEKIPTLLKDMGKSHTNKEDL